MYGERPNMPCSFSKRDYHSPWTSSWAVGMLDAGTSHVIAWLSSRESLGHACFSLFGPCTLSLSGTQQPPRWTQNVNQLLEWRRPCRCHVWSTNCWKGETCAACPCGLPLGQRRWVVDTSLRFELIFYIYFFYLNTYTCQVCCKHLIRPGLYVWILWGWAKLYPACAE